MRCVVFLAVRNVPLDDARPGRTHGLPDTQGLVTPAAYSASILLPDMIKRVLELSGNPMPVIRVRYYYCQPHPALTLTPTLNP